MRKSMIALAALLALAAMEPAVAEPGPELDGGFPRDYCQARPVPPVPPAPPDAPCEPGEPCPLSPEMEKERRMLEAIRVTRMTEALNLSEEQVAKFIPRLKQIEERHRQLRQERARLIKQLAEILEKPARHKEIKPKMEELDRLEQEHMQRTRQMMGDLDTLLSLEQQAKWRVFNDRFDDELREMVREIRKKRMHHQRIRSW